MEGLNGDVCKEAADRKKNKEKKEGMIIMAAMQGENLICPCSPVSTQANIRIKL